MQQDEGFVLKDRSVTCPECGLIFATRVLVDLPPVTESDVIEADLHRVLPHPGFRAALLAVCPDCAYADWAAKFTVSTINPLLLQPAPDLPHTRKFAMAVKCARLKNIHALDVAYIALNGLYCAREGGEDAAPWLELCLYEQSKGLDPENIVIETGSDHLTMGELWRQVGQFQRAVEQYQKAGMDGSVPAELLRQQTALASAGDARPTVLPPWMVRLVFPEAAELAMSEKSDTRTQPSIIVQESNPLAYFETSADGKLVPKVKVAKGAFDINIEAGGLLDLDPSDEAELLAAQQQMTNQVEAVAADVAATPRVVEPTQPASPVQEQAPSPAPAAEQPVASPVVEGVPIARVRQIIAVPHAASSVNLVQANESSVVSIAISANTIKQIATAAPAKDREDSVFAGAKDPHKKEEALDPTQRAVKRALKSSVRETPADASAEFPKVQILDEDSGYAYTGVHNAVPTKTVQEDEHDQYAQQPAAQTGGGQAAVDDKKTPQEAIAQVESFLSLTRQPSYQNWIRGYRR